MKVLVAFRDINNMDHIYKVGDEFNSNDKERVQSLVNRGLIEEGVMPSLNSKDTKPAKKKGRD